MATPEEEEASASTSETWFPDLGAKLGNGGLICVLFEAPTGFAIFTYDGVDLYLPSAIENIWADFLEDYLARSVVWLKKFETFDDKASAINAETGVSNRLATMIRDAVIPGQKLAVGNFEYKQIIEKELQIPCLFDKAVMELMWGLKNCMKALLPGAPEPTKEDCLLMSEGMNIVLRRYELEVELGTALMILCNFHDVLPPGDLLKVFTKDEYLKLQSHGPLYEGKIFKSSLKVVYKEMLWARLVRNRMVIDLRHYVREARKEYEAGQVFREARKEYETDQGFTSKVDLRKEEPERRPGTGTQDGA